MKVKLLDTRAVNALASYIESRRVSLPDLPRLVTTTSDNVVNFEAQDMRLWIVLEDMVSAAKAHGNSHLETAARAIYTALRTSWTSQTDYDNRFGKDTETWKPMAEDARAERGERTHKNVVPRTSGLAGAPPETTSSTTKENTVSNTLMSNTKKVKTTDMMKSNAIEALETATAQAVNRRLIKAVRNFLQEVAGAPIPEFFSTPFGENLLCMMVPSLLHYAATEIAPDSPKAQKVAEIAALAQKGASNQAALMLTVGVDGLFDKLLAEVGDTIEVNQAAKKKTQQAANA